MLRRKILPVFTAAVLFFAIPGTQKAHACPDANGVLTHCANFQVIAGIVAFITANIHRPPGAPGFGGFDRRPERVLGQLALFNLLYFSALMTAILTPLPSANAGAGDNTLDISGDNIQDGAFGRPLCGASGDCGAGPVGELFGGGPNSGYSCGSSAGQACGTDFYNPSLEGGLRNFATGTQPALTYDQARNSGSANVGTVVGTPINFTTFIDNHAYRNNLKTGAFDPFGGATEGSYINPRTGQTVIFDPDNPPPDVIKARELNAAYARGEINYPFYDDNWETRPISDFDPKQGNRGGVRPLGPSIASQLQGGLFPGATTGGTDGSAHSTTASGRSASDRLSTSGRTPDFTGPISFYSGAYDESLGKYFADQGLTFQPGQAGGGQTIIVQPGEGARNSVVVNQGSSPATAIRQNGRLLDTKPMRFGAQTYSVEIVEDKNGKLMALGTGENAGHVFGEVRKGTSRFGGYRREGPWQAPPQGATTSANTQTSSASQGSSSTSGDGADCSGNNCAIRIEPTRFEGGRFYIRINSQIAQNDRTDMSAYFTDGFETGNTAAWSSTIP